MSDEAKQPEEANSLTHLTITSPTMRDLFPEGLDEWSYIDPEPPVNDKIVRRIQWLLKRKGEQAALRYTYKRFYRVSSDTWGHQSRYLFKTVDPDRLPPAVLVVMLNATKTLSGTERWQDLRTRIVASVVERIGVEEAESLLRGIDS